jgi:hypothetical protein
MLVIEVIATFFSGLTDAIVNTEYPNHTIEIPSSQAEVLLGRLESLRSELGVVGEELIALLRDAGITPPPANPASENKSKAG